MPGVSGCTEAEEVSGWFLRVFLYCLSTSTLRLECLATGGFEVLASKKHPLEGLGDVVGCLGQLCIMKKLREVLLGVLLGLTKTRLIGFLVFF